MTGGEHAAPKVRKVRCDKGVKRGPRKASADVATRMGPVAIIRLVKGYGRELPPRHAEMLRGGGVLPRWAREYGSGNSGEGDERPSVGWQERVAEMAEKEAVERQLQARRAAVEARRDERERLSGEMGGEGEVCGREVGGEAGEGSEDPERGEVVPVRGIEEDGEARGDESRPLPVWHPRKRARATRRAAAAQAAEAARKEAGPSRAAGRDI